MINWIAYAVYWLLNGLFDVLSFQRFIHLTKRPRATQIALLKRILRDNKDSQIGRHHRFNYIRGLEDFRDQVGLSTYVDIKNELRLQETSGKYVVCARRFVYLNHNADPKNLKAFPFTADALRDARRDVRLTARSWLRHYGLFRHRVLTLMEDEPRSFSNTGLPQGTVTGFIYRNLPNFMRRRCISNNEVAGIKDPELRYLAYAIIALSEPHISCLLTANPATLIHLLYVINRDYDEICNAIEHGIVPERIQREIRSKRLFRASPRRASQLRTLSEAHERKSFGDIWPRMRGIICWTAGSCRSSLQYLRTQLPSGTPVLELGYQSSTSFGTINVDTKSNACLLPFHRNFYEFAERSPWEAGFGQLKLLDELVVGQEYYVLVTTRSGLYRLQTDQIVRVTGKVHNTPSFEFVQNGSSRTNVNGERLAESHVITAIEKLNAEHNCEISQFLMISDSERKRYKLYVESETSWETELVAGLFDTALASCNSEWAVKRMAERMEATELHRVPTGTINALRTSLVRDGYADPMFVLPHLQAQDDLSIDFSSFSIQ